MDKSLSIIINIYRIVNKYTFKILIFIAIMRINTLHTRIETRVLYNLLMQMQLRFYWSFETFCENNNILCNFWHCIPNKKDENETFSSLLSRITNEFNLPSDLSQSKRCRTGRGKNQRDILKQTKKISTKIFFSFIESILAGVEDTLLVW